MKRLEAPISAITIYPERARITRRGTVMLPKGEHVLALSDLPMTVEPDSVRANGADPHVTILHVDVTIQDNEEANQHERDALTQEFKTLLEQQAKCDDEISIQDERIAFLTEVRQSASADMGKGVALGDTPLQNLTDFMNYITSQLRDAQAARRQLIAERREIEIKLNTLQPKLPQELRATVPPPPPNSLNPPRLTFGRSPQNPPTVSPRFSPPPASNPAPPTPNNPSGGAKFIGRLVSRSNEGGQPNPPTPAPSNPFASRPAQSPPSPFTFARPPQFQSILVTVLVEQETEWVLEISYTVQNVEWEPSYDVRIDDDCVSMTLVALIYQNTGEDWPAVPLTITNARLSESGNMPRIRPWLIDAERPVPRAQRANRPRFGATPEHPQPANPNEGSLLRRIMSSSDSSANEPATSQTSGLSDRYDSLPMVSFDVTEMQVIRSAKHDKTFAKVYVSTLVFDWQMDYVAVPGQAQDVYKRARVKNTTDQTLLPGMLMIFNNTEFVGKGELRTIPPGETFSFQVGVEDRIRLDRKLLEQIATGPLSGNLRRTEFTYRITVANESNDDAIIALYDRLPIARNKQIKVFIKTILPEPKDQTDSNIYMWKVFLSPGQKQDIRLVFVLEHPRDMKLISLK